MSTSLIGTWMQNVAKSWLLYRLTHSELLLGMGGFLLYIPTMLLGPIAGVVADRFERRTIVIWTQALLLIQAAALAALTITGGISVAWILFLAGFQGVVDAFDRPARQAMLIQLADRDDLLSAISLNSVMFNVARIIGPSAGGMAIAAFGEGIAFSLNAVSFLAVLVSLAFLRLPRAVPVAHNSPLEHLVEGFRYLARAPKVWPLLGLSSVFNIASAPMFVLMPFVADALFHQGSQGYGFLTGAMGVGAVIGTIGLAARGSTEGLSRVVFMSTIIVGCAIAAFAGSPAFLVSLCIMPLYGYGIMRQNASTNTSIQLEVEERFRGRVMGMYSTSVIGMLPIGSLIGGALAQSVGVRTTLFGCSLVCIAAAMVFRKQNPE